MNTSSFLNPKFVLNSNYVITLDRIADKDMALVERLLKHDGMKAQIQEWRDLGIVGDDFKKTQILESELHGKVPAKQWRFLPFDTKHFKDLELEILGLFDHLDDELDGWLIKSENYQALKTLERRLVGQAQCIYIDPPFNLDDSGDFDYLANYEDSTWLAILENRLSLARGLMSDDGSIYLRCDYNGNMLARLLMNQVFGEDSFGNDIVLNRFKRQLKGLTKFNVATDTLLFYSRRGTPYFQEQFRPRLCSFCGQEKAPDWHPMISSGLRKPPERRIKGRLLYPPRGQHFKYTQTAIDKMDAEGRIRINESVAYTDINGNRSVGMPEYLQTEDSIVDSDWTDLRGYVLSARFPTENHEELLLRVVDVSSQPRSLVVDFFLGSGSTTAVAHKRGRKWLGVEVGQHFYEVALPRMKKVLSGEQTGVSQQTAWRGGGFFKYFQLEQYEDCLRRAKYKDADLFDDPNQDPYNQYVFLRDTKLLDAVKVDTKKNKVQVDLSRLYKGIDLPETLSNLTGKRIRRIKPDSVEFEDSTVIDLTKQDFEFFKLIKPMVWW